MSSFEEKYSRAGYNSRQQAHSTDSRQILARKPDELKKPKRGKIVKATQLADNNGIAKLIVSIRFFDVPSDIQQGSYNTSYVLTHTAEEIAVLYGNIEDIIGMTVMVQSVSGRSDTGSATIIANAGECDLEKASTLKPIGTLLAPAGSGL